LGFKAIANIILIV